MLCAVKVVFLIVVYVQFFHSGTLGINQVCLLLKDPGQQQAAVAAVRRWYYDQKDKTCKWFMFVQSGGNGNNFQTEEDCVSTCLPDLKCLFGEPLKNKDGRELNCGMVMKPDTCPANSYCKVHPADAYAVCCETLCSNGVPVVDNNGNQLFCGRGPGHQNCPPGSVCHIDPADRFAVCCPEQDDSNLCPLGGTALILNGTQVFCGRGPTHQACPSGYYCNVDPADRFAVCCRGDSNSHLCPRGMPLILNGTQVFCGRGPTHQDCPSGYNCNIDPADRFAVCCRDDSDNSHLCPRGKPLIRNGTQVFCGRGPNHQDCPSGYNCNIDPTDRFAVCCRITKG